MSCPIALARSTVARRLQLLTATIAIAVAGCAAGPDYHRPDIRPLTTDSYAAAGSDLTSAAAQDRWWTLLQDPVLDELVELALRQNPDLAGAEAMVRRAREGVRLAHASLLPAVNAAARVSDDKLSRNGENLALIPFTPKTTEFTDYRVGFDASWELDLAGRTRREAEAAVARFGSAAETRNDARVVVAAEVAGAYIDFCLAFQRLAVARSRLSSIGEILRLVDLQRMAGVAGDEERNRVDADRQGAAAAVAALEAMADASTFSLAALTAETPEQLRTRLVLARGVPATPAVVPVGLPSDLLRRRPDVRRAERELAAATADVASAVAAQFPRLSLIGDFGLDSVRLGDLTGAASRYWNLAPQLAIPLFAGGRLRSQVRAAEATSDAALASYRATVIRAVADAESCIVRYAAARSRTGLLSSAAAALQANAGFERVRYQAGDLSMIEVLTAERTSEDAAEQRLIAAADLGRSYVALNKALGGGWQREDRQNGL